MAAHLEDLALVAADAADLARTETLGRFRAVTARTKPDGSPVTEADIAAERAIRAHLAQATPDIGVCGEELGHEGDPTKGRWWMVDPIDGTIAYARGLPLYSTLISYVEDGTPLLGLIDLPALDERFVGWSGGGCTRNGQPVRVSTQASFDDALIAHGDRYAFEAMDLMDAYAELTTLAPCSRGYTDAVGHAMVLAGSVDLMIDAGLSPWDAAPTQVLVAEAGGLCLAARHMERTTLVLGAPALVEEAAKLLGRHGLTFEA